MATRFRIVTEAKVAKAQHLAGYYEALHRTSWLPSATPELYQHAYHAGKAQITGLGRSDK